MPTLDGSVSPSSRVRTMPPHVSNIDLYPWLPNYSTLINPSPLPPTPLAPAPPAPRSPLWRPSPSRIPHPDPSAVTKKIFRALTSDGAEDHADITLVSSDGTRIPALRMLLTISSPYFQKLLTSEFVESSLPEVRVSLPSTTLRQVLEFIYTDDCALIRVVRKKATSSGIPPGPISSIVHCNEIRALVELANAADYTGVERLVHTCEQTVLTVMRRFPHIACTLLQLLTHRCPTWSSHLLAAALRSIKFNVDIALLRNYDGCDVTCGVMHLDESAAERIFKTVKDKIHGQTEMFQVLLAWVSGGTALQQSSCKRLRDFGPIVVDTSKMKIVEDRRQFGKRIASWFDVKRFTPRFLSHVVETSGLLEPSAVSDAYKSVSLHYEGVITQLDDRLYSYKHEIAELRARLYDDDW